jgi:pimeloyl-ACP methyl ester carboxylesterase
MITRRAFAKIAAVVGGAVTVGGVSTEAIAAPLRTPASVVLVHGAYADGSCWSDVIPRLQACGVEVSSVQNPLTSLADDAAATRRVLDQRTKPTVLVGHSYAGSVISEVGDHPAVASLVYLSARAPEAGEDYPALAATFPTPPASAGLVYVNGFGHLREDAFLQHFANGVRLSRAKALHSAQGHVAQTLFGTKTTAAAWRSKPTRYLVTTDDRTTVPELQRFVARRMGAKTSELDSGHLSMITHPQVVANLILEAVAAAS